ncbi:hypothetical protein IWQ52_001278 [Labrenzia sp. EL_159]|nr:hypothetical protein [Labrenzia sp. EL_162]MBG6193776.1 hypothetical protein [Labrenzia sp. EL_159]
MPAIATHFNWDENYREAGAAHVSDTVARPRIERSRGRHPAAPERSKGLSIRTFHKETKI